MGIRDRMRLAFQPQAPGSAEPEPGLARSSLPEVEFVAYTERQRLSGRIAFAADRLTDLLNGAEEYELVDVTVESLADGARTTEASMVVLRDDLLAVHATGPRGTRGRLASTRSHPIVVRTGPYEIEGDIHVPPTNDPFVAMRRRPPMVPLTNGVISFELAGERIEQKVDVVIVNHVVMDWAVPATGDDQPTLQVPVKVDAHARDFTSEVHEERGPEPARASSADAGSAGAPAADPAAPDAVAPDATTVDATTVDATTVDAAAAAGPRQVFGAWAMPVADTAPAAPAASEADPQVGLEVVAPPPPPIQPAVLPGEGPVAALRRRLRESRPE